MISVDPWLLMALLVGAFLMGLGVGGAIQGNGKEKDEEAG